MIVKLSWKQYNEDIQDYFRKSSNCIFLASLRKHTNPIPRSLATQPELNPVIL
jgi:hypothetical protein